MFTCYRQLEHSDCGLTCIRMIARHFGARVSLKYLQSVSDLNRLGMSIKDIIDCCARIDIEARAVRIEAEHMRRMPLPAIIYWQQRHFVVLYKIDTRRKRYYVADPAQGKMCYGEEDFLRYWLAEGDNKGLAVLVEPTDDFGTKVYEQENHLRRFFGYIASFVARYRKSFGMMIFITALLMLADFSIPLLLRRTVDDGIGARDVGLVVALLLSQLAITVGSLVSSNTMNILLTKTGLGINMEMVNNFLERLARFPLSFFDRKVSSDFVQKINDQSRIKDFLITFPNSMWMMLLNMVVFSALLIHYSLPVFAVFIVMSLLEIGWNALFLNRRKTLDLAHFTNSSANRNHAYELTNGMADLKVNNAENSRIEKWKETQEALNRNSLQSAWLGVVQGSGHSVMSRIKELVITGISAVMVINGDMTIGIMMTLGYITGRLSEPFNTLSSSINSLQEAVLSYQRVDDVINGQSELRGDKTFSEATIRLDKVWFKYAGSASPFVIRDFSLTVPQGKVTALVGESGCGKSTLIKLMLGFYIPQKGKLTLSGYDVSDVDNADWLRHCGVVMQEGKIFTGSILENISLSESRPDADKAGRMLDMVGLSAFVSSLPMGIHTRLGVSGIELSGGQKQRLMIARALYKNPDILFLDEATSSLDANNERSIVERIREFGCGKTVVIAAHRLSTVCDADNIVFIKDGRIAEAGTHNELIEARGCYWSLVRNQLQLSV